MPSSTAARRNVRLFYRWFEAIISLALLIYALAPAQAQSIIGTGPATGTPANGTYAGSPDQLNLGNLNINLTVPLFKKTGRGVDYEYDLMYDSSVWIASGSNWTPRSAIKMGWYTGVPQTRLAGTTYASSSSTNCAPPTRFQSYPIVSYSGFTYTTSDGIVNIFPGTFSHNTCTGATTDLTNVKSGYGYSLTVTSGNTTAAAGTITDPSGNAFGVSFFANSHLSAFSPITDRNGNSIGTTAANGYTQFEDTADVVPLKITADMTNTSNGETFDSGLPQTLQYIDPNGNTQTITLQYQAFNVQTNFGVPNVADYVCSGCSTNLLSAVLMPDGSSYSFTYETTPGFSTSVTGRLASITLPTGGTISYQYTGGYNGIEPDGTAAGVIRTTSDGPVTYTRSNVVAASGTTNGSSTTTVTDAYKNQTVMSFAEYGSTRYFYETLRNVYAGSASGMPLRSIATCYSSNSSSCNSQALTVPFTEIYKSTTLENGLTSATDTQFNAAGLVTQTAEYDYSASSPTRTTAFSYASLGNNILDKPQTITQTDGSGNELSSVVFGYDDSSCSLVATSGLPNHAAVSGSRGNLTTTTTWVNSTQSLVTHTCSDDAGQVRSSTDPSGNVTQYSYDSSTDTFLTGVTYPTPSSGVALSTSTAYDSNTGAVLTLTDANSQKTTLTYDSSIRPVTITSPAIAAGTPTTSFTYPSFTQTNVSRATGTGVTATAEVLVDGYGRKSRTAVYNGQSSNPYYQQDFCYDEAGRLSFTSLPYQSTGFGVSAHCNNTGDSTQYDALNRPLKVTHADGTYFSYAYGGRAVETTDEGNGSSTPLTRALQSDGLGRLVSVCEITSVALVNSGSPSACGLDIGSLTGYSTSYTYNLAQHTTTIAQGTAQIARVFQTDGAGRTISVTEPERSTTTYGYTYNSTGLQVVRTRPSANQTNVSTTTATTTQFDSLGRAVNIGYNDGLTPSKSFYYDTLPTGLGWSQSPTFMKGRLVATSSGSGANAAATLMSYDANGNAIGLWSCAPSICGTASQSSRSETFGYDLTGNLTQEADSASGAINYGRSAAGEITSVTNTTYTGSTSIPNLVSSVVNTSFGRTSYMQGNGLQSVTSYDTMGRNNGNWLCTGSSSPYCSGGTQIYGNTLSYTGAAVTNSCDTVLNQCQNHGYDAFNRLVSVTDQSSNSGIPGSYAYTYDRYGNRWTQTSTSGGPSPGYSFSATNNQMTTLPYDAAGNVMNDGAAMPHSYTYDAEGNVTKVDGGNTAQYVYDAFNNRVRVQTSSQSNEYLFDAFGQRVSTWSISGNSATEGRVYADGQQIGFLSNGTAYLEQQNWLGVERMRTDSLGHEAATESSLAFGDNFSQTVFDSGSNLDNSQFAGQEYDTESATQHAQFRQYSSTQGRWLGPDPYGGSYDFGNPQSFNRYAYALNNPLSLIDPSGLEESAPATSDDGGGAAQTAGYDGLLGGIGYVLHQLSNLAGDLGGALGGLFNSSPGGAGGGGGAGGAGDPSSGWLGGGTVPQPAGIPMTLGYQNVARPAQQQSATSSTSTTGTTAQDHYVSIGYWPTGAGGFGHIGLQVDSNDTQGYSTKDPSVHWWQRLFGAPAGGTEDDITQHTKNGETATHFYHHISITADQATAMQGAMAAGNGGHYNLIFNNCAQFVESVLHSGGVWAPHAEIFGPAVLAGILSLEH